MFRRCAVFLAAALCLAAPCLGSAPARAGNGGAAEGAVIGGLTGAILGGVLIGTGTGVLLGGAIGASAGAVIGRNRGPQGYYYVRRGNCHFRYPNGRVVRVSYDYCY